MESARPMPVADLDSAPWWEALRRRELLLQRCDDCGRHRWPPRAVCNDCGSLAWQWLPASGGGTVASWTVSHHAFGPGIETPFVVVLVRLDDQDDIYIPGYVDGPSDGAGLEIGARVTVGFADFPSADGGSITLLRWNRVPADS